MTPTRRCRRTGPPICACLSSARRPLQLRLDPLTGEWIAVATARQNRVVMPPAGLDPLAPQVPGNPSEIPSDYDVAVFENRSPGLRARPA